MASTSPYLVGLVGAGVTGSLTPPLHMEEGRAHGLAYVYEPIDLTARGLSPDALPEILDWAERLGFSALNITYPCKQAVLPLLDRLDPVAASLGAVNTVLFGPDGRIGHNTDTTGYEHAFRAGLPDAEIGAVLQFGAGGAGSAVADALLRIGVRRLTIVDLEPARAVALADQLSRRHRTVVDALADPRELPGIVRACDGVVNCTPQGMHHHPGTPFETALLRPGQWVSEVVYRPRETQLLREARERGCVTLDGGRMAVFQAAHAFRLITGIQPDLDRMLRHFQRLVTDDEASTESKENVHR
ncbi:shikimate dehydrogenase [Microbacterium sp.]|uniref:shikimate dehydrogenase n=1 Tax=Microbacterium sp. TaxID=51671 RepID=UPI0039E3452B